MNIGELMNRRKQIAIYILAAGAVLWAGVTIKSFVTGGNDAQAQDLTRLFICAETGQTFQYTLKIGDTIPVRSPYTGANTGYPAELCYWTKDGGTTNDPTPVLLNEYKEIHAPTFCPVCGRLVVFRNPGPAPGRKPPPTEDEYNALLARRRAQLQGSDR
jgi:hypothetical protein